MSSVITTSFHNSVAEDVLSEIIGNTSRYYYYFGNTEPAPETPETPLNSPKYIAQTRNNMITLMQVSSNDVSLVLVRNDWVSGVRYNMYESAFEGTPTNFYVITDEYNVYKCLDNGVAGAVSTVKPTGLDVDPITTADGYKWKFMYNVPLALRNKFMTAAYIPVSTGLRNRFFSSGEIDSLIIEKSGAGYTEPTTSITVTGDGVGADLSPVISGGQVVGVIINNPGSGYTYATVTVVSSIVTDPADVASIIANMANGNINSQQAIIENLTTPGTIDSISVVNGGVGFTVSPTVTIVGDGTGATATATVVNGSISKINIVNPGINYTTATVSLSNIGGASGYSLSANVSPPLGHGRNAVKELFADTLMFYGNMTGNSINGFTLTNDYHQYGLIKNVRSTSYNIDIAEQASSGKYIILTNDDISAFNIGDQISTETYSDLYTITMKQVSSTTNALEVVSNSDTVPHIDTLFNKVAGIQTFTSIGVKYENLLGTRSATFCYIVTATFDPLVIVNDVILTKGNFNFIVVSATDTELLLQPINGGTISNGDTLSFGAVNVVASTVQSPSVDKHTGDILTIDNRPAFFQSSEQSVSTRTVIRF